MAFACAQCADRALPAALCWSGLFWDFSKSAVSAFLSASPEFWQAQVAVGVAHPKAEVAMPRCALYGGLARMQSSRPAPHTEALCVSVCRTLSALPGALSLWGLVGWKHGRHTLQESWPWVVAARKCKLWQRVCILGLRQVDTCLPTYLDTQLRNDRPGAQPLDSGINRGRQGDRMPVEAMGAHQQRSHLGPARAGTRIAR